MLADAKRNTKRNTIELPTAGSGSYTKFLESNIVLRDLENIISQYKGLCGELTATFYNNPYK